MRVGDTVLQVAADGSLISEISDDMEQVLNNHPAWRFVPAPAATLVEAPVADVVSSTAEQETTTSTQPPKKRRGRRPKSELSDGE